LLRAGILAELMAERGHTVHWWSSSFDHQLKKQRSDGYQQIAYRPHATLHLLPGRAYSSNVSLARIGNHRDNAAAFAEHAAGCAQRPDVILCSYPTLELCEAALEYARPHGIPVVVDVRDLWPDVFEELVPGVLRPFVRIALSAMYRQSRRVLAGATALTGITPEFVSWGARRAGRASRATDRAFAMAYVERPPAPEVMDQARARWQALGVTQGQLNFVFFGSIGRQFDLSTVIAAARQVRDPRARFIICGTGDRLAQYQKEAADCPNVVFPGWIDAAMIRSLMSMSVAGLAPYHLSDNFNSNIPNKIVEYLAGGLPILTTLSGVPGQLLAERGCGITYGHEDAAGLRAAIETLIADPASTQLMSAQALNVYKERFDATHVYGAMIDHLHALARRSASTQPETLAHAGTAA
jgi:glycosyltransferase involved in cell wall biosynthesis